MSERPTISVCMITYGHEEFISQAITSVLNQKTSFSFELVIANDSSPDSTDTIIQTIIKSHKYGHLIKYHKHVENIGMMSNFAFALNECRGKYIAICEGDDYWIDINKLQIQATFLENNEDYVLIGHNAKINRDKIEEDNLVRDYQTDYVDFRTSDLIEKNPFVTSATMFKNIGFADILKLLDNFVVGDWPLFTMLSFKGKCRFYSKPLGFYRIHANSVTSKNRINYIPYKNEFINRINHAIYWNKFSDGKYNFEENLVKQKRSRQLSNIALKHRDFKTAMYYSQFINVKELDKLYSKIIVRGLKFINWVFN